jgi:serine/threonine protein kinase
MSISNGADDRHESGHDPGHDVVDPPPALAVGFVIGGKYQIKRVLGVGGNGAVYDCEHTEIGHRAAVKVAHHKLDDRGDVMARFRREARICGSLRHPHVGQVFDVGTLEDGAPFMVMELQEGRSLADVIDDTKLPIAAIVHITRQLLSGLAAAHQAGVIHLDIKPDNVMLVRDHGGDVVAKLVDFGISRRLNEPEPERASSSDEGFIVGSPDYMPPEQLRGEPVDTYTDVYATGVLLYEAITGRTPFDAAETTAELVESIMRDPIPLPTGLRSDCPLELERVVMKALSRNPADRYPSAEAMSRALAEVGVVTRATPAANLDAFSKQPDRARPSTTLRRRRTIDQRMLQTLRIPKPLGMKPLWRMVTPPALAPFTLSGLTGPAAQRARARRLRIAAAVAAALAGVLLIGWLSMRETASDAGVVTATELPVVAAPVAVAATAVAPAAAPAAAPATPAAPVVEAPAAAPPSALPVEAPAAVSPSDETATEAAATDDSEPAATTSHRRSAQARRARKSAASAPATAKPAPAVTAPPAPPPPPEQDPQLTRTQLLAAEAAFNSGQDAKALSLFRQLVKAAPRAAEAWRGLAAAANRQAERSEAERALRRYLQLKPGARDAAQILQLKRL